MEKLQQAAGFNNRIMSEEEFDLMDELYFVHSYDYLKKELNWEDAMLLATLQLLHEKEWIKCFLNPEEEVFKDLDIENNGRNYLYLATKKGLMEHNSI